MKGYRFDGAFREVYPLRPQCPAEKPSTVWTVQLHLQKALLYQACVLHRMKPFPILGNGRWCCSIDRRGWSSSESASPTTLRTCHNAAPAAIGQPEAEMEAVRRKDGIPLQLEVVQWMRDTCEKLSVRCLFWGLPKRCALRNQN